MRLITILGLTGVIDFLKGTARHFSLESKFKKVNNALMKGSGSAKYQQSVFSVAKSFFRLAKNIYVLPTILIICIPFVALSEEYTFTNKADQKTFTATVKSISSGTVIVEKDGRDFALSISNLVDEDVSYLKQWYKDNPSYAVRLILTQKTGRSPNPPVKSKKEKKSNTEKQNTSPKRITAPGKITSIDAKHFVIALTNDSSDNLEDAEIHYKVFVKSTHKSATLTNQTGIIPIPKVAIGETINIATNTILLPNRTHSIPIFDSTINGNIDFNSNMKTRTFSTKTNLKGIWLRVYKDGLMLKEIKKLDGSLKNDASASWY